jgi:hypothetical protein
MNGEIRREIVERFGVIFGESTVTTEHCTSVAEMEEENRGMSSRGSAGKTIHRSIIQPTFDRKVFLDIG